MTIKSRTIRPTGDQTRNQIIQAAEKLFANKGFSGTSISMIAAKAKVNRSLIFHHFKNKEELWKAVKSSFADNMGETLEPLQIAQQGLKIFLKKILTQRFELYEKNPDLARMMAWQHLEENNSALLGGPKITLKEWAKAIEYLQKNGEVNSKLNPELVSIHMAVSISGAFLSRLPIFQFPENKQAYLQLVINGLHKILSTSSR